MGPDDALLYTTPRCGTTVPKNGEKTAFTDRRAVAAHQVLLLDNAVSGPAGLPDTNGQKVLISSS